MERARALQLAVGLALAGTGATYWLDWRLVLLGLGSLIALDAFDLPAHLWRRRSSEDGKEGK